MVLMMAGKRVVMLVVELAEMMVVVMAATMELM
jgi:hypothetical protein